MVPVFVLSGKRLGPIWYGRRMVFYLPNKTSLTKLIPTCASINPAGTASASRRVKGGTSIIGWGSDQRESCRVFRQDPIWLSHRRLRKAEHAPVQRQEQRDQVLGGFNHHKVNQAAPLHPSLCCNPKTMPQRVTLVQEDLVDAGDESIAGQLRNDALQRADLHLIHQAGGEKGPGGAAFVHIFRFNTNSPLACRTAILALLPVPQGERS